VRFLVLVLLLCACGQTPPRTITIDPGFSEAQEQIIFDALDHWCEATGGDWCPEVVAAPGHDGGRITPDAHYDNLGRHPLSTGFHQNRTVRINLNHSAVQNLDTFWHVAAHELGHFGIEGHPVTPEPAVMSAHHQTEPLPNCIDEASAEAWCAQQGCLFPRGTCG
jgi:hypothetical protein